MDAKRIHEIETECANHIIDACGEKGILESVDNNKLSGSAKVFHKNAMEACEKFKDKDGHVNPHVQAIMARIYGLI